MGRDKQTTGAIAKEVFETAARRSTVIEEGGIVSRRSIWIVDARQSSHC